mgnify:FL=1
MALEINIGKIRSVKGARQTFELETDTFDFMVPDWQLSKPLSVSLEVVNEGRYLSLAGTVKTTVEGRCSRCLDKVTQTVETVLAEQLLYAKDAYLYDHLAVGELEEQFYLYENDLFDISEIVRESILAALPMKILCRDDCRGLCLKCGQNLNRGQCDCDTTEIDPRLAILAKLKATEEV